MEAIHGGACGANASAAPLGDACCGLDRAHSFTRSSSLCSTQTLLQEGASFTSAGLPRVDSFRREASWCDESNALYASSDECLGDQATPAAADTPLAELAAADGAAGDGASAGEPAAPRGAAAAYLACLEMIRRHKVAEAGVLAQVSRLAGGAVLDDGSRMIVVSWCVEVAEEFGLQQETLHAAVALLDRFLGTSQQGVPRCVLQLVAVGCLFLASKQLEVRHPSVEQMVAVAAHSFAAADLLRVERILLDALDFSVAAPTPYGFLHLLTQAMLGGGGGGGAGAAAAAAAPAAAAAGGSGPPMEVAVSLAMYLTELALLDQSCLALPGSQVATAALLLAHTTLSRHTAAWPGVLAAAGLTEADVGPALAALGRLHVAAALPPTPQLAELLLPLKAKFGADCWCRVAADVQPLALQQQHQHQQQQQAAQHHQLVEQPQQMVFA